MRLVSLLCTLPVCLAEPTQIAKNFFATASEEEQRASISDLLRDVNAGTASSFNSVNVTTANIASVLDGIVEGLISRSILTGSSFNKNIEQFASKLAPNTESEKTVGAVLVESFATNTPGGYSWPERYRYSSNAQNTKVTVDMPAYDEGSEKLLSNMM